VLFFHYNYRHSQRPKGLNIYIRDEAASGHYNTERSHLGYRNMGKRPIDTINEFLKMSDMKVS